MLESISNMDIKNVVFLDDMFRQEYIHSRRFIYTVLSEPLRQVLNVEVPDTYNYPVKRGLINDFDEDEFKRLAGSKKWHLIYNKINEEAENYLISCFPSNVLIIGYEMPNWLLIILKKVNLNNFYWINIRMSPVRFCKDLNLVLQSNIDYNNNFKESYKLSESEIKIEAGLIKAKILNSKFNLESLSEIKDNIVFIGQTKNDASLIEGDGKFLCVNDFKEKIIEICNNKKVYYKPHPYELEYMDEVNKLCDILGQEIIIINDDIYSILGTSNDLILVAISSGVTQEASFFNKKSYCLHIPVCTYNGIDDFHCRFHLFSSVGFWFDIFNVKNDNKSSIFVENEMRNLHNAWFGYSDFILKYDSFRREEFHYFFSTERKVLMKKIRILYSIIFINLVLVFILWIK
jgi:hypothetical protein